MIFTGNSNYRTGKFNHVIERSKALKKHKDVEVDVFLIQKTYSRTFSSFKNIKVKHEEYTEIDGLRVTNLWVHKTLWDYILVHKFKLKDITCKKQLNQYVSKFQKYDLLSVNGLLDSSLASIVKKCYSIPFVITWHGSDINVYPYRSNTTFKLVKKLLESTDYNFFVSKNLLHKSNRISENKNKDYLYIGPNSQFYKVSDNQRNKIREEYKLNTKHIIGFVGNMKSVKNVLVLPEIFKNIQKEILNTSFIIVGEGTLLEALKTKMIEHGIQNVVYTGLVRPEEIPKIMNMLDILVLPSKNEGLGLVALEAQKCGAHVVGSKVGGIPEAVKGENVFSLNKDFTDKISNRIIEIIQNNEKSEPLLKEFSLDFAVKKELKIYCKIAKA